MMIRFGVGRTMKRLDAMLTEAMDGSFCEENYDETQLSRLESKWKHYLAASKMSMEQSAKERQNIKELVSDISHQTKTPLANIVLYSELLKEQLKDSGENQLVGQIYAETRKLEFLIQSLIKMSRLETNMFEVQPQKQAVALLVSNAVNEVKVKAKGKRIRIEYLQDGGAKAEYDRKWTAEALNNILDNAVKYSPEGSTITVQVKEFEMYVCILVTDEGIGIAEEERAQIFRRFYRSSRVQQEEGVGIGLYLAREILRREGGYIKVQSQLEKGSCFGVYLPKVRGE